MQSLIDIVQRKETALQRLKIDYIALFNQKQEVDAKVSFVFYITAYFLMK